MARPKKYLTEEERKAIQREQTKQWKAANKEHVAGYNAEYKEKYRQTPEGRVRMLLDGYKKSDKLYNRGECTLTAEWIMENIFSKPCHYCGETDWHELGCDRIDNSLPHTPDNVVPCCAECNKKRGTTPYDEYMRLIGEFADNLK